MLDHSKRLPGFEESPRFAFFPLGFFFCPYILSHPLHSCPRDRPTPLSFSPRNFSKCSTLLFFRDYFSMQAFFFLGFDPFSFYAVVSSFSLGSIPSFLVNVPFPNIPLKLTLSLEVRSPLVQFVQTRTFFHQEILPSSVRVKLLFLGSSCWPWLNWLLFLTTVPSLLPLPPSFFLFYLPPLS